MVSKVTTRPNGVAIFGCVVMAACLMCSAVFTATAAAVDAPVVTKTGVLGGNETWEAGSVYAVPTSVVVPDGVTLTVDAGAIVKTNTAATGIVVEPGGTLNVTGSAVSPAVFTSYADDSHGGDSNADGASAGSLNDYASAIEAAGGTLAISHATFDYGTYAITSSPDPEQCSAAPAAAITDSTFHSGVEFEDCASSLSMQRNAFAMPSGYASMPLVAKGVGDASGITLSGADSNTFTGTGVHTMVSLDDFTLPVESAWDISGSAGISVLNFSGVVRGTLTLPEDITILNSGLYVIGGTVTVGAGSNVKIRDSADGFNLSAGATLTVAGTEAKPVIFTSQRDDTAGGDTNNDSDETLPSESNYNRLVVNRGSSHTTMDWVQIKYVTTAAQITSGEATLTNAQISSATDGIIAAGTATVTFRGSFAAISDRAVIACNWGAACAVDATSTSWGSDDGPLPAEGTALICGAVTYSPWLTSTGTAGDETSPVALNCNATNS